MDRRGASEGFTLIEIAVVLVIIGLIVGGILTGREMYVQSEMRRLVKDIEQYKTAVNTFRGKYDCIPGDCANATTFFGVSSKGCFTLNSGFISASGGTGTCNGDGDGTVMVCGSGPQCVIAREEPALVFNHLSLAKLVPGNYDGTHATAGVLGLLVDVNTPSTIRGAAVTMLQHGLDPSSSIYTNAFTVGSLNGSSGIYAEGGTFTTAEASAIDKKYDDGNIVKGNILGTPWSGWSQPLNCMSDTLVYDLTKKSPICGLNFRFDIN